MSKSLLIIFVKQPKPGLVKTRLAATIGADRALAVYRQLLQHTHDITAPLSCDKIVHYTPDIEQHDLWEEGRYRKAKQATGDLGERMLHAFQQGFKAGYERICIIGSDCYQLTTGILQQAYTQLAQQEVVIGPTRDGGYYLLGMTRLHPAFFQQKQWSTSSVCKDTVADAEQAGLFYAMLPELIDVDEEKDLITMQ